MDERSHLRNRVVPFYIDTEMILGSCNADEGEAIGVRQVEARA